VQHPIQLLANSAGDRTHPSALESGAMRDPSDPSSWRCGRSVHQCIREPLRRNAFMEYQSDVGSPWLTGWQHQLPLLRDTTLIVDQNARGRPGWSSLSSLHSSAERVCLCSYSTLSAALNRAQAGTMIRIKPGEYNEGETVVKTAVQIVGDATSISEVMLHGLFLFEVPPLSLLLSLIHICCDIIKGTQDSKI
jgi:hypothetical protein